MQPAQTQADPQATETYKKLGLAAIKIVYDPKISQQLLVILKSVKDPADGIAQATTAILKEMQQQIKGAPPNVIYAIAPALAVMVAEIGHAAGVLQPTPQLIRQALQLVVQKNAQPAPAAPAAPAPAQPAGLINQGVQ